MRARTDTTWFEHWNANPWSEDPYLPDPEPHNVRYHQPPRPERVIGVNPEWGEFSERRKEVNRERMRRKRAERKAQSVET